MSDVRRLGALFFPGFELLDTFGPLEMFGNCQGAIEIVTVASTPGPVRSTQGPEVVAQYGFADCPPLDLLLIPGGMGTRDAVHDDAIVEWVRTRGEAAELVMTVCTGTALPAQAGLLDGRRATTNKAVFAWLETTWPKVQWVRAARWVEDGKFVTSSGVSAGIDMALAVVAKLLSPQLADGLALGTEYDWHRDASWDPFAKAHGLV